jgi:hypothetical protein
MSYRSWRYLFARKLSQEKLGEYPKINEFTEENSILSCKWRQKMIVPL